MEVPNKDNGTNMDIESINDPTRRISNSGDTFLNNLPEEDQNQDYNGTFLYAAPDKNNRIPGQKNTNYKIGTERGKDLNFRSVKCLSRHL